MGRDAVPPVSQTPNATRLPIRQTPHNQQSHFLIISHSDTANTAPGGFYIGHLAPLFILRRGRCAAVSQFLIFLTATQRTQRLDTFAFAALRTLSILRRGRCAAVSHFLIFLTATQRTQRLEAFAFAASRASSFFAVVAVPP